MWVFLGNESFLFWGCWRHKIAMHMSRDIGSQKLKSGPLRHCALHKGIWWTALGLGKAFFLEDVFFLAIVVCGNGMGGGMLLCWSTGHGHDFMRIAHWFSSLAAFACCYLLLLADQALLQAVGGVVGACWCRLLELLVPVGGWSCWCSCSCVKSDECLRFWLRRVAIVNCSTIDNRTLDCSTINNRSQSIVRLFDNRSFAACMPVRHVCGQYSLHYYAIFMHADEIFLIHILHASFACIKMA